MTGALETSIVESIEGRKDSIATLISICTLLSIGVSCMIISMGRGMPPKAVNKYYKLKIGGRCEWNKDDEDTLTHRLRYVLDHAQLGTFR